MYAMKAMKQYQQVSIEAQVSDASPHRLIQLLMQGGLERLAQARGAMERGQVSEKGILIGKAIGIIGGLREALDSQHGGELAGNLDRLYEYMIARLVEANTSNDASLLDEVSALLLEVKSGWDGISH
ncbi:MULTISPECIES: flagellar export chaperone FliS [Pseudomonas aeruginosa group]|uniref:flagellar export chaperone FliS n=1 Tax=Pseudomonas aeruginosa group TaxID=136841 RepID=UPI0006B29AC1|nr:MULTISPECIES: flagellar export chaperone FliS [Pseudomonas aeruginosa group]VTS64688.1 Flagellar protein fliS [Streptococcus dysgalactiae subsp. equisimilis]AVR69015.1 flagella export chaperone FliS [Pseudomonas paraeruginosa]KRU87743.1 flagellar export chaperone FliS [Pseudomonas aeruginosa]KSF73413.1 flagellar protein FliS [Pseudomonas aeruginosa]KSP93994.1 flagellar protein FliS [Pseudomonas aeruginosa]